MVAFMLFYNLGKGYLIQTDEAFHATNAYEMYKQNNWIVNTYRYSVDYFNSKPPLCLDLMIISYKIFGVSGFAARFPSAIGGLFTCLVMVVFLLSNKKYYAAAFFPLFLAACSNLFTFHMFRAAEMDAIYNLFFCIAMISLYIMQEKPDFMYVYGLSLGLAFMCKGPHAALIFIIGLLFIPKIKKAFTSIKRVILSIILAASLPFAWMVKRYMFDGFEMLNALFVGEVAERVTESEQDYYLALIDFFTSNITVIFAIILVLTILISILVKSRNNDNNVNPFIEFVSDNYLFIIWAVVPVMFFTVLKSYLTWYTYTSQIAMCVLTARLLDYGINRIYNEKIAPQILMLCAVTVSGLLFTVPTILNDIIVAGTGGNPIDQYTTELMDFKEKVGNTYSGVNAYLISNYRVDMSVEDHWEPDYVAPAEMYLDVIPVDGSVENFLSDPESILILDKDLWDEYSSVLTGHVILQDNSYLIISSEMY